MCPLSHPAFDSCSIHLWQGSTESFTYFMFTNANRFVLQTDRSWDSQSRLKSSRACHGGGVYTPAGQLIGLLMFSILIWSGSSPSDRTNKRKVQGALHFVLKLKECQFGGGKSLTEASYLSYVSRLSVICQYDISL